MSNNKLMSSFKFAKIKFPVPEDLDEHKVLVITIDKKIKNIGTEILRWFEHEPNNLTLYIPLFDTDNENNVKKVFDELAKTYDFQTINGYSAYALMSYDVYQIDNEDIDDCTSITLFDSIPNALNSISSSFTGFDFDCDKITLFNVLLCKHDENGESIFADYYTEYNGIKYNIIETYEIFTGCFNHENVF